MNRFEVISKEKVVVAYDCYHAVIKDKITGVLYYYTESTQRSTMTPLLGSDGKPLVDKTD